MAKRISPYARAERLIHDAALSLARERSKALPKAQTRRVPSKGEANCEYIPPGYRSIICWHDRFWFEACPKCNRAASITL